MENNKYYVPTLEEFHIGFEYQKLIENKWIDVIVTWGKDWDCCTQKFNINDIGNFFKLRVKYLDQEDIESCGFKYINDNYYTFHDTHELYILGNHRVLIKEILTESNMNKRLDNPHTVYYHLFDGVIKNKSVFKQVLKMIGVE